MTYNGWTPLHFAADNGLIRCATPGFKPFPTLQVTWSPLSTCWTTALRSTFSQRCGKARNFVVEVHVVIAGQGHAVLRRGRAWAVWSGEAPDCLRRRHSRQ